MRIRQIKPSYYLDKALWTRARAETREFYQALWLIADDAGWLEWDSTVIGAEVYVFVPVRRRERDIERHAEILRSLEPAAPHLVLHECGHAEVPKMPQHQRLSGPTRRVTTIWDAHQRVCLAPSRVSPHIPAEARPVGNGRERVGNGKGSARERETTGGLVDKLGTFEAITGQAAAGVTPLIVVGRKS